MDLSDIDVSNISVSEVQKLAKDLKDGLPNGWTNTKGISPLKLYFQIMKRLLEETKKQIDNERLKQVKILTDLTIQQTQKSAVRIRK